MIQGFIKTKDILIHPLLISRSFGPWFYFQCIYHALSSKPETFLDLLRLTHKL